MYISKNKIIRRIRKAAQNYKKFLVGKKFLLVYEDSFLEIMFTSKAFFHLTGVNSTLSAINFYRHQMYDRY